MRTIQASKNKLLFLGYQGENEVTTITFDVSGWEDLYGSGTFTLINQRPTESYGYSCSVTLEDEVVSWVVGDADVYFAGNGQVQLTYTVDDQIAKSIVFFTRVQKSLAIGDVEDPVPDWAADITERLESLEESYEIATTSDIDSALYS